VKRIPAFVLILSRFAWSAPVHAETYRGPNSPQQAQTGAKKYQRGRLANSETEKNLAKAQTQASQEAET